MSKACSNCHKMKVKCDAQKPCTRCKSKNLSCDLCDEALPSPSSSSDKEGSPPATFEDQFLELRNSVLAKRLERPLAYSPNGIIFSDNIEQRNQRAAMLPHRMLRVAWDSGFAERDFIECFRHMTPALSSAIDTALTAVETLAFSGTPQPVSTEISSPSTDDFTLTLPESERVGILQQCWDPVSRRRIAANFNNYMAQLVGSPREVGLTALGRSECRCALTDLRFIAHVLNTLLNFSQDEDVNYLRWSPLCMLGDWDKAILVRMTRRLSRDALNRPNQIKMWYTVVSEEEYDAARSLNPEICEAMVSELPGVPRTGKELMRAENIEQQESFKYMIGTREGRARMDNLATVILTRFAGVIRAAQATRAACGDSTPPPNGSAGILAPPPSGTGDLGPGAQCDRAESQASPELPPKMQSCKSESQPASGVTGISGPGLNLNGGPS